jgi:K+-sensing histidine kinase KdpD
MTLVDPSANQHTEVYTAAERVLDSSCRRASCRAIRGAEETVGDVLGRTRTIGGAVELAELARQWTSMVLRTAHCSTAIAAPARNGRLRRIAEAGPPISAGPDVVRARRDAFRTRTPRSGMHDGSCTSFMPIVVGDAAVAVLEVQVETSRPVDRARLQVVADAVEVSVAAEDRCREADRSLDMGVALTAHEIQGPLAGVRAVMERYLEGDAGRTELRRARHELDRVVGSVHALLEHCVHGVAPVLESVDLGELVRHLAASSELAGPGRIEISGEDGVIVAGDRVQLHSAIDNLMRNALTHSPAGEPVRVSIERRGFEGVVIVEDRGSGILVEQLSAIFDPLVRGSDPCVGASGHGLGLFLAKRVIEGHGGAIEVSTRPGATTFQARFPLMERQAS